MRRAAVYFNKRLAGWLLESELGYDFRYDERYVEDPTARPISFSFPLINSEQVFRSPSLFPFFDGLIPEGWYLEIASKTLKVDPQDRFGMLLATANHTIGAVTVKPAEDALS